MKEGYIIAIDQGTTGTTILVIDYYGMIVYKYHEDFAQRYPQPGWVEHDPELIWATVERGLNEIVSLEWLAPEKIISVGITNQRETIVLWDRVTGKPVYPAIVWQCRRTADRCAALNKEGAGKLIEAKTGLRLDPYFSATKIEWIFKQYPELKNRAEMGELACGTIDSWLIWKLTGGRIHATDYSNASRTMLFNIHDLVWDRELLDIFGIPSSILPIVKPSAGFFGATDPALTISNIPISGVLGDQQAALYGQGCLEPGMMKTTYGTGCFMLMNTGKQVYTPENGLLTSIAWGINGEISYVLEGSVFVGGAVVQWLRDELGLIEQAGDSEHLAMTVQDSNGVYLVPAFTGLGAPHWDPYARGTMVGLTRGVNRAHIVRAALEGIAFQVREVVESMSNTVKTKAAVLRVDGGAAVNNFLMQFQADVCDIRIERNSSLELTGVGAAFVAGIGAGFWESEKELKGMITLERSFEPKMAVDKREKLYYGWRKAVERSKGWAEEG